LAERWKFKLLRNFNQADRIYDELFNAGVYVNDEREEWRADGKSCNYQLCPQAGPINTKLSEAKIHKLLETSFRLKLKKDFTSANHFHTQLLEAGAYIDQDNKQWRGDGIKHNYQLSALAGPIKSTLSHDEIHELLAKRWRCKVSQDFDNADSIYFELLYGGIFVDDETMEWRADGIYHIYRQSPDSAPFASPLSEEEIHNFLGKRLRHKKKRDFLKADRIYEHLKEANVYVDDRIKEWRADGIKYPFLLHAYRLSPEAGEFNATLSIVEIHRLLGERWQSKLSRDFDKADLILETLNGAGVFVHEWKKEWRADGVDFPKGM
jgi:hypothetical protein